MRLNEKTFEINYCAQASAWWYPAFRTVWWWLTQKQERHFGFDAATQLGMRHIIFQFKMLSRTTNQAKQGELRYKAEHEQMADLRRRAMAPGVAFYVLPEIEKMAEFRKNSDLLQQSWLLDVQQLPYLIPAATGTYKIGKRKATPSHTIYIDPPNAVVHSEPMHAKVLKFNALFEHREERPMSLSSIGMNTRELANFIGEVNATKVSYPHTYVCSIDLRQ